jgi:epidermal growth factor receptor kinase substrate 8
MAFWITHLSFQANLISEDIESAISDSKGGKQKRRPEALR